MPTPFKVVGALFCIWVCVLIAAPIIVNLDNRQGAGGKCRPFDVTAAVDRDLRFAQKMVTDRMLIYAAILEYITNREIIRFYNKTNPVPSIPQQQEVK